MNEVSSPQTEHSEPVDSIASAQARFNRTRPWLVGLAALPAILPLLVIFHYHVDLVWNDAWDLGELLIRGHNHTLRFADFWALHNEHRMPIPYLIMFGLAHLTGWNLYSEALFGFAMACVLSALLAMLLRSTASAGQAWVWQWFLINILIFSTIQCENWQFGFASCQNFFPIPCLVAAMLLLARKGVSWPSVFLAGVLVEIASLSQANGLLGLPTMYRIMKVCESGSMCSTKWAICIRP